MLGRIFIASSMPTRKNLSTKGEVDRSQVIGEGSFRRVYQGTYRDGPRRGKLQVAKELIHSTPYTSTVFDYDISVARRAAEIVESWNGSNFIDRMIMVNIPEVWEYTSKPELAGVRHLVEPFLQNFEKFNSNTGWAPPHQCRWTQVMQVRTLCRLACTCSTNIFLSNITVL